MMSERYKTSRSMKPNNKEISLLLDKKSIPSTSQPNKKAAAIEKEANEVEEQINNHEKQVACKEQIKMF